MKKTYFVSVFFIHLLFLNTSLGFRLSDSNPGFIAAPPNRSLHNVFIMQRH